jgi:hypothetical protein
MTQPNEGGGSSPAKPPAPKDKATVEVLTVVEFTHEDPILGGTRHDLGVVVGVDDQGVDVVPLAGHRVRVSSDDVARLTADALG